MNESLLDCQTELPLDSYKLFLDKFGIREEEFFQFGLEETIFIDPEDVKKTWDELKSSILNKQQVYFRQYGGNGKNTPLLVDFYKTSLGFDGSLLKVSTNDKPTKLLEKLKKLKKNENIFNYQVSHIFERTKNIYAFTAPWNIVFMPKMFDPFTGHETKSKMVDIKKFQTMFQQKSYKLYEECILEFNEIVLDIHSVIDDYFNNQKYPSSYSETEIKKFQDDIKNKEFAPILINLASKP